MIYDFMTWTMERPIRAWPMTFECRKDPLLLAAWSVSSGHPKTRLSLSDRDEQRVTFQLRVRGAAPVVAPPRLSRVTMGRPM